jgi:hypothetical protein
MRCRRTTCCGSRMRQTLQEQAAEADVGSVCSAHQPTGWALAAVGCNHTPIIGPIRDAPGSTSRGRISSKRGEAV